MKRTIANWRLRTRTVELGRRTLVMGVVNITPDSFSDGGLFLAPEKAIAHAIQLLDEGADLLDLGAESTRPGSLAGGADATVSAEEEKSRLLPVLEGILKERPGTLLSVDTYKAETARAALTAGAEIVNDVSGFGWDPALASVCAEFGAGVILMHTRGKPDEWRTLARLPGNQLFEAVRLGLSTSIATAQHAGIASDAIVLDPGYGFGKKGEENFQLMVRQSDLLTFGHPLAIGVSRKSFISHALSGLTISESTAIYDREAASLAALTAAILFGASIVRVHSVQPSLESARIADSLLAAMESS